MKLRMPGFRPMSSESRAGVGAAVGLLAVVSAVELADGPTPHYIGLLAAAPFLAAALAPWRGVVTVGVLATAASFVLWFCCVQQVGAAAAGVTSGVAAPAAALVGMAVGGPMSGPVAWFGIGLIAVGLVVSARRGSG